MVSKYQYHTLTAFYKLFLMFFLIPPPHSHTHTLSLSLSFTTTERGLDSDFALALLMSALSRRKSLRLILMSATISTDKFASYLGTGLLPANTTSSTTSFSTSSTSFSTSSTSFSISSTALSNASSTSSSRPVLPFQTQNNRSDDEYGLYIPPPLVSLSLPQPNSAPVMFIPGYTYPVVEYYKNNFEDILRGHIDLNYRRPFGSENTNIGQDPLNSRIGGLKRPGDIDYDLLIRLIIKLAIGGKSGGKSGNNNKNNNDNNNSNNKDTSNNSEEHSEEGMFLRAEGSVLIFLPGVPEINRTIRLLSEVWEGTEKATYAPELKIMPL